VETEILSSSRHVGSAEMIPEHGFVFLDAPVHGKIISNGESTPAKFTRPNSETLVSCLLVTRGNLEILRHSINCFLRQTYPHRELIVIVQDLPFELSAYLKSVDHPNHPIRIFVAPASLRLGDLRNMSIARATGSLICQWDDDDLHHPDYLQFMVGFIEANNVAGVFLNQWTMWWPARRRFALSRYYHWEGSMVAHKSRVPVYPDLGKSEDTFVAKALVKQNPFAIVMAPHLYVYTITGHNTWDGEHMELLMSGAGSGHCPPNAYDDIFDRLNDMYDISAYQNFCLSTFPGQ
jgi:glycosyltransferase involved in cell wall biosynthesis